VALVVALAAAGWGMWSVHETVAAPARETVSIVTAVVPVDGQPTGILETGDGRPLYVNRLDMPTDRACVWLATPCPRGWVPLTILRSQRLSTTGIAVSNGYPEFLDMTSIGTQCFLEYRGHILYTRAGATASGGDLPGTVGADWSIAVLTIPPYSWEAIPAPRYQNRNCPSQ
jgi:hypothetical protein